MPFAAPQVFVGGLYRLLRNRFRFGHGLPNLAPKQFGQRQIQFCGKGFQKRHLREAQAPLPLGNGGVAHVQPLRQLLLGQAFFLSRFGDEGTGLFRVHGIPPFLTAF